MVNGQFALANDQQATGNGQLATDLFLKFEIYILQCLIMTANFIVRAEALNSTSLCHSLVLHTCGQL